jgi:hypothetical protein
MTQNALCPSKRIHIRCTNCHARLCDRILQDEDWLLHYKKSRTVILTNWMLQTCYSCNTIHRIRGDTGIIESIRDAYHHAPGIQAQTSDSANSG